MALKPGQLKRLPSPIFHKAQHVLATEISKRRAPGLPDKLKRAKALRAEQARLLAEQRELDAEIQAACTHSERSIEHESHDADDTLGSHSHTSHYLRCNDCRKRWDIGTEYGYGRTIIIDGVQVHGSKWAPR